MAKRPHESVEDAQTEHQPWWTGGVDVVADRQQTLRRVETCPWREHNHTVKKRRIGMERVALTSLLLGCVSGLLGQQIAWAMTAQRTTSAVVQLPSRENEENVNVPFAPTSAAPHSNSKFCSGIIGRTIVLDAGHGGVDGGAQGMAGVQEKDINLAVTRRLAHLLRQAGAVVHMTRNEDDDLASDEDTRLHRRHHGDLRNRLKVVRDTAAAVFISIHCNAVASPTWRGAETLYMEGNRDGERLAKIMQTHFQQDLLPTHRQANDVDSLYLLKRIQGPAVLAEIGFITNPTEGAALQTAAYQQRVAFSIYTSLIEYFNTPNIVATGP